MTRSRIETSVLAMTGAVLAVCVAACTGAVSGGAAGPGVPSISQTSGSVSEPGSGSPEPSASAPPVTTNPPAAQPPAPAPEPEPAAPGDCKAAELSLSLGHGEGTAGTFYRALRFTNTGKRTCTIQGFPGVSYVAGDDGHQVGPAAFRSGPKGAPIQLAPGATVNAPVGFVEVRNFDPAVCRPTPVRGLRVYPPHDTAAMFVPLDNALGCAGTPPGNQLVVQTVRTGAGV